MLDLYERLKKELGIDLKGFRIIHAQVIRPQDFPRFKALGVIAEVNPYHISDDMRWMEERIGHERAREPTPSSRSSKTGPRSASVRIGRARTPPTISCTPNI